LTSLIKKRSSITIKATLIEKHVFIANKIRKEIQEKHIATEGPIIESGQQTIDVLQVPIPANAKPSIKCPLIEVKYIVSILIDDKNSGIKFNFIVIIIDEDNEMSESM